MKEGNVKTAGGEMKPFSSLLDSGITDVYKSFGVHDDDGYKSDSDSVASFVFDKRASVPLIEADYDVEMDPFIPVPAAFSVEYFRDAAEDEWTRIDAESKPWSSLLNAYPNALVARLKTLVSEKEPSQILQMIEQDKETDKYNGILDVVCKFNEISVTQGSPIRYETRILLLYGDGSLYNTASFHDTVSFLPSNNRPYATIENLDSFLMRRKLAQGEVDQDTAMKMLQHHMKNHVPCASLFLKLCSQHPGECLVMLQEMATADSMLPAAILGERALHKLAVSVVGPDSGKKGATKKAMQVLEIGVQPRDWGYVAFNTLLRMAKEEGLDETQTKALIDLIHHSSLDVPDKVALLLLTGQKTINADPTTSSTFSTVHSICTSKHTTLQHQAIQEILDLLQPGTSSSCHLVSILLRTCVEHDNYEVGWEIASRMAAVSKQVFGEAVTLCSKAYFSLIKVRGQDTAEQCDVWFDRIQWCVERHLVFLNRYPCGLALHVAANRRDFESCWRWYKLMCDQLAFRLTGYHTSAVLKAASFDEYPDITRIQEAYLATPTPERTTFTFVPLVRVWENTEAENRGIHIEFFSKIAADIKACLKATRPPKQDSAMGKVVEKLSMWCDELYQWKKTTRNGTSIPPHMRQKRTRRSSRRLSSSKGLPRRSASGGPHLQRHDSSSSIDSALSDASPFHTSDPILSREDCLRHRNSSPSPIAPPRSSRSGSLSSNAESLVSSRRGSVSDFTDPLHEFRRSRSGSRHEPIHDVLTQTMGA